MMFYIVFISAAVLVLLSTHYYLYIRLIRDTALPRRWRRPATAALALMMISQPVTMALTRVVGPDTGRKLLYLPYIWMGMLLFFMFFLVLGDLLRLAVRLANALKGAGQAPRDPSRRVAMSRVVASATTVTTVGLAAVGNRTAVAGATVLRQDVTLDRLPRALDGVTIAQLSDLHVGPTLGRGWVEGVVARTLALKPDLVAITGDLMDGKVSLVKPSLQPLARLAEAPLGCFFVTGNHEYYTQTSELLAEVDRLGMRILRNERVSVGRHGASFDLAGVDDSTAGRHLPDHGPDLKRALAGRDPSREVVLLAHQPREVFAAAPLDVGLLLSGHTHGGQFWPWNYLVYLQQPYVAGLVRHPGSRTQVYVNQGTGFWGPPMRVRTASEITLLTLRAGKT